MSTDEAPIDRARMTKAQLLAECDRVTGVWEDQCRIIQHERARANLAEQQLADARKATQRNGNALEDLQVAIRAFAVSRCPHAMPLFTKPRGSMYGFVDAALGSEPSESAQADADMLAHLFKMACA